MNLSPIHSKRIFLFATILLLIFISLVLLAYIYDVNIIEFIIPTAYAESSPEPADSSSEESDQDSLSSEAKLENFAQHMLDRIAYVKGIDLPEQDKLNTTISYYADALDSDFPHDIARRAECASIFKLQLVAAGYEQVSVDDLVQDAPTPRSLESSSSEAESVISQEKIMDNPAKRALDESDSSSLPPSKKIKK